MPLSDVTATRGNRVYVASRLASKPATAVGGMPSVRSQLETEKQRTAIALAAEAAATARLDRLSTTARCLRSELTQADVELSHALARADELASELAAERRAREVVEQQYTAERSVAETLAAELERAQLQSKQQQEQLTTVHGALVSMRDVELPAAMRATELQRSRAERAEETARRCVTSTPGCSTHLSGQISVCLILPLVDPTYTRLHFAPRAGSRRACKASARRCGRASGTLSSCEAHSARTRLAASRRSPNGLSARSASCTPSVDCTRSRGSKRSKTWCAPPSPHVGYTAATNRCATAEVAERDR